MEITAVPQHALPVEDPRGRRPEKAGNGGGDTPAQVRKVANEFEAMFVAMMLKSMRETVGKDSLTGGGRGEETFRSLLDQEYASTAVAGGGIGLARTLEKELSRGLQGPVPVKGVPDAD
uniref:Rod binding protein-like protein n=1 Tax=Geobacter sp. (strain M21) TaxID=443144 RepID=C6E7J9_GEOSM